MLKVATEGHIILLLSIVLHSKSTAFVLEVATEGHINLLLFIVLHSQSTALVL